MPGAEHEEGSSTAITIDRKVTMAFVLTLVTQIFLGGFFVAGANSELKWMKEKISLVTVGQYSKTEADLHHSSFSRRIDSLERMSLSQLARLREIEINAGNRRERSSK